MASEADVVVIRRDGGADRRKSQSTFLLAPTPGPRAATRFEGAFRKLPEIARTSIASSLIIGLSHDRQPPGAPPSPCCRMDLEHGFGRIADVALTLAQRALPWAGRSFDADPPSGIDRSDNNNPNVAIQDRPSSRVHPYIPDLH
jgi:hypothetical protein